MVDLVPKQVGKFESNGLGDAILIGVIKSIEEKALMGVIGNGTIKSGVIKGAAGGVISGFIGGKAGKLVSSALAIDAVEDVVCGILGAANAGNGNNNNENAW